MFHVDDEVITFMSAPYLYLKTPMLYWCKIKCLKWFALTHLETITKVFLKFLLATDARLQG